jgi:ornithine cyclodeaminase
MRATALELGLGERITLIPTLADPKDLFGVLRTLAA